ncbi:hypothetical protein [Mesorhizobium sp. Z1-4]|uniref:hypothetical protein n=1 Tax=Mesorhizobium sp. Z1-4 TaxID=2448478 RepID=UPI001FDEB6F9|nr:hypothetical protein [Mesorhizobium sp. Z1-4]
MFSVVTPLRAMIAAAALVALLFVAGWLTRQDPDERPYLDILGGGFVFNYRVADNFYGFTAIVRRPLESGSIIEAEFEDPAGGDPIMVRERVSPMTDRYAMRTPALHGIEANKPYRVTIRVLDRLETKEIWSATRSYSSQIGQERTPEKALTVGPGYHLNPENPDGK